MTNSHTVLTCEAYTCTAILAVLPGLWDRRAPLRAGEKAGPGCGAIVCQKCKTRWEVRPRWEEMEAALREAQDERRAA